MGIEFILIIFILMLMLIACNVLEIKNKKFSKIVLEYIFPYINCAKIWKKIGMFFHCLSLIFFTAFGYFCLVKKYNKLISIDIIIGTLGTFIIITLIIRLVINCIKIFNDYIYCVNNMKVTYVCSVPIIIITVGVSSKWSINHYYELIIVLVSIMISLQTVYKEILKIILTPNYIYGQDIKINNKKIMNKKIFKLKGIFVWFSIILLNLYSALVFFYKYTSDFITLKDSVHPYFDLFYYLIITFTTIGYGDILPKSYYCKFLSMIIALSGLLFISVFIGTLLSSNDN